MALSATKWYPAFHQTLEANNKLKEFLSLPHCVIFYWIFTIMANEKAAQISRLWLIIPTPTLKSELHPISPSLQIAEQLQNRIPKYAEALLKPTPMQHRYLQAPGMTSQTHTIISGSLGPNEAKVDLRGYLDYHWAQMFQLQTTLTVTELNYLPSLEPYHSPKLSDKNKHTFAGFQYIEYKNPRANIHI